MGSFIKLLILVPLLVLFSCSRNNHYQGEFFVTFSSDMTCHSGGDLKSDNPSPETSCIKYTYVGDSLLTLSHLNAGFNCCPENFAVDIEVKGDSLIVREEDVKQLCRCNCLYNLDILVHNLPADTYHVRIVEPYVQGDEARLVFDLHLKSETEGQFCVTRPEAWWY
jgi:hypothetical protein